MFWVNWWQNRLIWQRTTCTFLPVKINCQKIIKKYGKWIAQKSFYTIIYCDFQLFLVYTSIFQLQLNIDLDKFWIVYIDCSKKFAKKCKKTTNWYWKRQGLIGHEIIELQYLQTHVFYNRPSINDVVSWGRGGLPKR